jgi:hypothetical protein
VLIGLSGTAQVGKDSVGSILVSNYGFKRIAFADVMKAFALAVDPIIGFMSGRPIIEPVRLADVVERVGWERAKQNPEVRHLLQRIGTEGGRKIFGETFWVDMTINALDSSEDWVVTDARFWNEAEAIKVKGGIMVRIHRPGVEAPNGHVSEHELSGYDFDRHLHNDGSWSELHDRVRAAFPELALVPA